MSRVLTVREMALAAHNAEEEANRRRREQAAEDRRIRDEKADALALEMVSAHPWVQRHLPNVKWKLVTRHFPQNSACVCPVGEPHLCLVITEGQDYAVMCRPQFDHMDPHQPLVNGTTVRSLADIGRELSDRARRPGGEELIQP